MDERIVLDRFGIRIVNDDFLHTSLIDQESIDLIVTSPPYNIDVHYGYFDDTIPYDKYIEFTHQWLEKALILLKTDGRLCINIPLDKNKGGQQSVYADVVTAAKEVGYKYHTTIIWNEQNISRRTAWGSWLSASAPYVIAPVEMIVVLYKDDWKKSKQGGRSDIDRKEFLEWTNGMWTFSGEKKSRIGHPAPFPLELPKRCIKLFSFVDDLILDPFMGSGTTLMAAWELGRKTIGVDIQKSYCELTVTRLKSAKIYQRKLAL